MTEKIIWLSPVNLPDLLRHVFETVEPAGVVVLEGALKRIAPILPPPTPRIPPAFHRQAAESPDLLAYEASPDFIVAFGSVHRLAPSWQDDICALQVFHKGACAFIAADNFHHACISIRPGAPEGLPEKLIASGSARRVGSQN